MCVLLNVCIFMPLKVYDDDGKRKLLTTCLLIVALKLEKTQIIRIYVQVGPNYPQILHPPI